MILGFQREVDENCALLGYYAESSGNFLPTSGTAYRSHRQEITTTRAVITLKNAIPYIYYGFRSLSWQMWIRERQVSSDTCLSDLPRSINLNL